ncbi:hypothetical protein J3D54_005292 [Pseudomonas sp. GGS8]|uniref:hypothetical protein n=1 Tax=Pseudomonas sp. GGS8 TaxID=2817892 RepID=UPI0020A17F0F|nr:hypothetical protein [Pseudomonas sp. GGS8]MCP1446160.1 hypothetical protein [Pseudomonas sp. GGS8]
MDETLGIEMSQRRNTPDQERRKPAGQDRARLIPRSEQVVANGPISATNTTHQNKELAPPKRSS